MKILEHTIRNILSGIKEEQPIDEMGLPGGTDKFQGSQFAGASSKTVTPKIRPGHNEGSEKAANARNTQKARFSQTMHNKVHEEEQLDEIVPALAAAAPYAGPALAAAGAAGIGALMGKKPIENMWKAGKKGAENLSNKIDSVINPSPEELKRAQDALSAKKLDVAPDVGAKKTEVPAPPAITTTAAPAPAKVGSTTTAAPPTPAITTAKPEAPPIQTTAAAKPAAATPAATKATTTPASATTTVTGTAAPAVSKPISATKAATAAATTAATASKLGKFPGLPGMGSGSNKNSTHAFADKIANPTTTHSARKHKVYEEKQSEGTKERLKVTNVGRPWTAPSNFSSKSKLAKQAEIRTKIIDEGKKLSGIVKDTVKEKKTTEQDPSETGKTVVYPQVIFNPPIKRPDNNRDS
jgi:hypothetical protein